MTRPIIRLFAALLLAGSAAGCDSALPLLVGDHNGPQGKAKFAPVKPFMMAYTPTQIDPVNAQLTGEPIGPPTVSSADTESEENSAATQPTSGPRTPIAVAPLTGDSAQLSNLGAAALRSGPPREGRFVLLVLSPAAANPTEMARNNERSRSAAGAAIKAISGMGIPEENIEVAAATNAEVGDGEIRLYRR